MRIYDGGRCCNVLGAHKVMMIRSARFSPEDNTVTHHLRAQDTLPIREGDSVVEP